MAKKCWAFGLGDCSSDISREHIISSAFFESTEIQVTGFDWTGDEIKTISTKNVVSKLLCRKHNSALSELYCEIKNIRESFKLFSQEIREFAATPIEREYKVHRIDGAKFERWLLKTTINVILSSPKKYNSYFPNYYEVELVFGKSQFNYEKRTGLYAVHPNFYKNKILPAQSVNIRPCILTINQQSTLLGSLVTFFGMPFFLNTLDPQSENIGGFVTPDGYNLIDKTLYHPPHINSFKNGKLVRQPGIEFSYIQI